MLAAANKRLRNARMILDEDVRRLFQVRLAKQGKFGGHPTSLQIFRGVSALSWKGQHAAGCFRHFTIFGKFNVIPEYCFDCCKVLIEPRTVVELFKLLLVFEKLDLPDNNTRKCICESREFCSGAYKGFVYCRGIEDAMKVRDLVRQVVVDEISPDIPVTMKRGCSEFERAYPGYDRIDPGGVVMEYRKEWKSKEHFVDKNAVFSSQRDIERVEPYGLEEIFATHYWLSYAATIGDDSYLQITGCPVPPIPQLKRPAFAAKKD